MKAAFTATLLAIALASSPAWSQNRWARVGASGEIMIPTQAELEREAFTEPRNNFSSIDNLADGELNRMDREIDNLVERGICNGC